MYILLILRSPKGGCCSISDDLSCSYIERLNSTSYKLHDIIFNGYFAEVCNSSNCCVVDEEC